MTSLAIDSRLLALHEERLARCLTSELIDEFQTQGAVCIRGLLTPGELTVLRNAIDENLAAPGPLAMQASKPDDPGKFVEDFCNWQRILGYQAFLRESPLSLLAKRLMQSDSVRFYHDHLLVKEAATRQPTPWHQDQPYYNIDGVQNVSMWIPVDPVPRESTLEFLARSHKGSWLMPRTFMTQEAKWFPEGSLKELPEIEKTRGNFPIIGWALEPGDFVCFHMLTLHASAGSRDLRRVFSARFLGDDIRHAPRPWRTSPPFAGLENELAAGAEMIHPLFPRML